MKRVQDWLLRFRWQKLLLVWGVFLLIAAVLFAERSGVQYTHTRFRLSYLPQEQAHLQGAGAAGAARHLPAAL